MTLFEFSLGKIVFNYLVADCFFNFDSSQFFAVYDFQQRFILFKRNLLSIRVQFIKFVKGTRMYI